MQQQESRAVSDPKADIFFWYKYIVLYIHTLGCVLCSVISAAIFCECMWNEFNLLRTFWYIRTAYTYTHTRRHALFLTTHTHKGTFINIISTELYVCASSFFTILYAMLIISFYFVSRKIGLIRSLYQVIK